jgi:hypothetical protein
MRYLIATCLLSLLTFTLFSQSIEWAPNTVNPKGNNPRSVLRFPYNPGKEYYILERDIGDAVVRTKQSVYLQTVDASTFSVTNDANFNPIVPDGKGKDYYAGPNFILKNKLYSFYLDGDGDDEYTIYSTVQETKDGKTVKAFEPFQKSDISKSRIRDIGFIGLAAKREKKNVDLGFAMGSYKIAPVYDGRSIISAFITKTEDKESSILTINEWDENLKANTTVDYKIPYKQGKAGGFSRNPRIEEVVKDKNGFVYVTARTCMDESAPDRYSVYQFKLSDPAYKKVYTKEFTKGFKAIHIDLFQDVSGKVFLSTVGYQGDEGSDEYFYVNAAFIGTFNDAGQLDVIYNKPLTTDMMYNFESEKKVDKKGAVNKLRIRDILPTSTGGCYVVWQYEWTESKDNGRGETRSTYIDDNILVQYYNKEKKLAWQKPLFKHQATKDNVSGAYSGYKALLLNDDLHIFYPDDKKNATKAQDDKDVATFSVVQFGDKDLAGIVSATFTMSGTATRNYVAWPDDKVGYAFMPASMKYLGNNEFIGAARRVKQGALFLKAEQYVFFRLKF